MGEGQTGNAMNHYAAAGNHGGDVRSDCRVQVQPAAPGSARLHIESKVQALYGRSIERLIRSGLAALECSDLDVEVQDSGALPYTLLARLEAAVRRLYPDLPAHRTCLPEINQAAAASPVRDRLRRTRLYLPGNTPKYFINAGLHQPDAVILDLEDSVAPEEKDAARLLVRNALRVVNFYGAEKMVRINPLPGGMIDVLALAEHGVQTFLVPKAEDPQELRNLSERLDELAASGVAPEISLIPIIESALGIQRAFEIAAATSRIIALAIGLEDYARDIGAQRTTGGMESLWARSQVVNAARAAGIQPLGSVFSDLEDRLGLEQFVRDARSLGFEGVGCLHPRQVAPVHQAFTPAAAEIDAAVEVVRTYQEARRQGMGVASLRGKMIDPPVFARAMHTLRLAGYEESLL